MPILFYITMWSCVLGMTSAFAPAAPPLESKSGAQRASGPRD
jgi:hypothetical protein